MLHDRFSMTHDVTWVDQVWDPNTRPFEIRARIDNNLDRTNTWGLHLGYSQPVGDSGWRAGAIVTTNLMSHPKLPDYQISQVMTIPWDPGHSAAYDFGVGIAKTQGLTTFGVDAIYEPIRTHTWGETPDSIVTDAARFRPAPRRRRIIFASRTRSFAPASGRNFRSTRCARAARRPRPVRPRAAIDRLHARSARPRGAELAQPARELDRVDAHVGPRPSLPRSRDPLRRTQTTGTGRPGVIDEWRRRSCSPASADRRPELLSAPNGPTSLTGVAVTTHQLSVSVPIR